MHNHTMEACRKRNCPETDRNTRHTKNRRNDKQSCHHCSPSEQFRLDWIYFNCARNQCNNVNTGTVSQATAGDRNLLWLANNTTALATASAPGAWVIDSEACYHIVNDWTRLYSAKKLCQRIDMKLGDDNTLTLIHHELVYISLQ